MDKSSRHATLDWTSESEYWRGTYRHRPYVSAHADYEYWEPAYHYGFESAERYPNRKWEDVESDLRSGWTTYPHRHGESTWESVKAAVRDAWDRIVGNR